MKLSEINPDKLRYYNLPTLDDMVANIIAVYDASSVKERILGETWYEYAMITIAQFSEIYGYNSNQIAGVFSAMSPLLSWEQNTTVARNFLFSFVVGYMSFSTAKKMGYGVFSRSLKKAIDCVESSGDFTEVENLFRTKTGKKTLNFYRNLCGFRDCVTVDRHVIRSATKGVEERKGKRKNSGSVAITPNQYDCIAYAYHIAAEKLQINVTDLQAITWVFYAMGENE